MQENTHCHSPQRNLSLPMPYIPNLPGIYPPFLESDLRSYEHREEHYPLFDNPPTVHFANGQPIPRRLDLMEVGDEVSCGKPQIDSWRSYNLGTQDFTALIEIGQTREGDTSEYDAVINSYGLSDEDLETLLRYLEQRVNTVRQWWFSSYYEPDILPRWAQEHDPTCTSIPRINIRNLRREPDGSFTPRELRFGPGLMQISIEHFDGAASHPGATELEAELYGLLRDTTGGFPFANWGKEGPFLDANMACDTENADPFIALRYGGDLADTTEWRLQGIELQFWLFSLAEALRHYRTSAGFGVDDAFNDLVGREFSDDEEFGGH